MAKFRQQDVRNPHFSLPFRLSGRNGGAIVNEQDSSDDIRDCVKAIAAFPIGSRQELPDFGRADLVFQMEDSDMAADMLMAAISLWERRSTLDVSGESVIGDEFLRTLLVKLGVSDV